MNETECLQHMLRVHGVEHSEAAVDLATRWLRNAERLRTTVEGVVDATVGPATVVAHAPAPSLTVRQP